MTLRSYGALQNGLADNVINGATLPASEARARTAILGVLGEGPIRLSGPSA